MLYGDPIRRAFFNRPCLEVARDLVGSILLRRLADGTRLAGRLVEVEAYLGDGSDPGAHSHRGPTPRNRSMFGPPGRLYVYRSYGIHACANVVCEREGSAAGVLLRALEPLEGIDTMRRNRGLAGDRPGPPIASGPGRLCQAFALGLEHDGASLLRGDLQLRWAGQEMEPLRVERGRRVGLNRGAELPHRFYAPDNPWVSRWRDGARRHSKSKSKSSARGPEPFTPPADR
jgi:DNA-3-methyladenine glycosylase